MNPYQHFGLERPPFEATPDPRFFYGSPSHTEAQATLQYTVYARKPCTLVVGESGLGKTLLARLAAATASQQAGVLWIHGVGQPKGLTELSIFPRGALTQSGSAAPPATATLAEWLRSPPRGGGSPLLVVDDADALPEHSWQELLALLSRDFQLPQPVKLAIFAAPRLLSRLASADMIRLRRRIFRTCALRPLNAEQVKEYVACRLTAAGGSGAEVFTPEALSRLASLTRGNPGLLNQVCENALLEAFGEGSSRVGAMHVLAAAKALTGAHALLPTPEDGSLDGRVGRRLLTVRPAPAEALHELSAEDAAIFDRVADEQGIERSGGFRFAEPTLQVEGADFGSAPPAQKSISIERRLWQLEARLADTLSAVRRLPHPTAGGRGATDDPVAPATAQEADVVD